MKLLIHVHTHYSYDCLMKTETIIDFAVLNNIDIVAITDHDTIKGSVEAQKYVSKNNISVKIIVGAEYKTDCGDIIGLFLHKEINEKSALKLIEQIHQQGGIAILPHPYNSHKLTSEIIRKIDLIETFNSRCSDLENNKALNLAIEYNKPIISGVDAHIKKELSLGYNILVSDDFPKAFFQPKTFVGFKTTKINIIRSQVIKAFKQKDLKLFLKMLKSLISILFISKIKRLFKMNKSKNERLY